MKIKYLEETIIEGTIIEQLEKVISNQFKDVVNTKGSRNIKIGRDKYISLDYDSYKYCSCYIELGNTYMRYDRTLKELLYIVKNDSYIKRNFKY